MAQMEYRSIGVRLRPPRFVVGYRPGHDWIYTARQVVASISRVWGGNGAAIAPLGESGAMTEALASIMRAYDPDHIAVHVPIVADLAHEDPEIVDKMVEGRANRGEDRDEVWQKLRTMPVNIEGLDALAEQASSYFFAFQEPSPGMRRLSPGDIVWLHRYGDSRRDLATVKDPLRCANSCIGSIPGRSGDSAYGGKPYPEVWTPRTVKVAISNPTASNGGGSSRHHPPSDYRHGPT